MKKKKNGFLTFCFAFVPGAGQMYLGYMHRGLSIVTLFALIIMAASFFSFLGLGILGFLLPIIWMYSFFDTFRIAGMTPEEESANPDAFLFDPAEFMGEKWRSLLRGRHKIIGIVLIALGAYMLYRNFLYPAVMRLVYEFNLAWLDRLMSGLPVLLMAIVIIGLGVWLIKGPSRRDDDYTAYVGTKQLPGEEDDGNE